MPRIATTAGPIPGDPPAQRFCPRHQLVRLELGGAARGAGDQARDPDATGVQVLDVGRIEAVGGVDLVVGDPGAVQRGIEPVAAPPERRPGRDRRQAGVDPHEQQPDVRPEQVRDRAAELVTDRCHRRPPYRDGRIAADVNTTVACGGPDDPDVHAERGDQPGR